MIPYGRQDISEDDIKAVIEILNSDFLTQGPVTPSFEEAVAKYCNSKSAFAMNSSTSALHAACFALDVSPGDAVWTSANTFAASSNCALYCGASVDFVDIDPSTYNMCVKALEEKLILAQKNNSLPKVVIPVHLCGQSCDMKRISELGKEYNFRIIEDASHAIGGSYNNNKIGSCEFSDISVFSFHPVKIITTGEGGMALTNDKSCMKKLELFRTHGITRNLDYMENNTDEPWYYEQIELGFNYRMTEIQSALGKSQLTRLDNFIDARLKIVQMYKELLVDLPLKLPYCDPAIISSWHLYVVRVDREIVKKSHKDIFRELRSLGVGVNLHYIPVYLHPYYRKLGFQPGYCKEAEKYYSEAISLPIYPGLSIKQQNEVASCISKVLLK